MGDVTMPGCSNAEVDPHEMDSVLQYLEDNIPTLNLDELAPPETVHEDGMVNNNQWDWNNGDNEYNLNNPLDIDFTNGLEGENPEYVAPIPVWPPVSTPFNCSYCQVLREIIHQNGAISMKLEIHGRIGFICHAIYEMRTNVIDAPPIVNHQMVDFTMQSMDSVKQFIVQYCQNRAREGYALMQNPLSVFYDALCYGLNWFNNGPPEAGHHTTPADTNDARPLKPDLGIQRQRSKEITLSDLTRWFHAPETTAATELQLSLTVIKNKCREFGVERWPYRTVESYNKKISTLEESIREGTSKPNANRQIENLRKKLEDIYACRPQRDMPAARGRRRRR
ncbi:hypothetical protein MKW92_033292 [Papaver armeniacum]|nr:hypothetical protein MKW92_033292 [Papaver armeniacum]